MDGCASSFVADHKHTCKCAPRFSRFSQGRNPHFCFDDVGRHLAGDFGTGSGKALMLYVPHSATWGRSSQTQNWSCWEGSLRIGMTNIYHTLDWVFLKMGMSLLRRPPLKERSPFWCPLLNQSKMGTLEKDTWIGPASFSSPILFFHGREAKSASSIAAIAKKRSSFLHHTSGKLQEVKPPHLNMSVQVAIALSVCCWLGAGGWY